LAILRLVLASILVLGLIATGCASVDKQWQRTENKNTREAYRKFIKKHRNSEYADEAQNRIDDFDWNVGLAEAKATPDLPEEAAAYQAFIKNNRENRNVPEAKQRRHEVMMDIGWREVKDTPSILTWERFLKVYRVTPDHESRPIIEAWAYDRLVDASPPRTSDLELFVSVFAVPRSKRHVEASLLLEEIAYKALKAKSEPRLQDYERFMRDHAVFDSKRYREVAARIEVAPIVLAAQQGDQEKLRVLLRNFTGDIESENHLGWTPLQAAARWNQLFSAKILIEAGASCDPETNAEQKPIAWASNHADHAMVVLLVDCGAQVNPEDTSTGGGIPLFHAAAHGDRAVFQYLIAAGADPTLVSGDGQSALYLAVASGSVSIARQLLQLGADVNRVDPKGDTALSLATRVKSRKLVYEVLARSNRASQLRALERSKSDPVTRQILVEVAGETHPDSEDFLLVCTTIANLGQSPAETRELLGAPIRQIEGTNGLRSRNGEKWIYSDAQVSPSQERIVAIHFFDDEATACSIDDGEHMRGPTTLRGRFVDGEIPYVRYE
jgi:ankyrin repeat protein